MVVARAGYRVMHGKANLWPVQIDNEAHTSKDRV